VSKVGRPKQFDGDPVSVRLPSHLHDALSVEALRRSVSLADVIRERLELRSPKLPSGVPESQNSNHQQ
jgi:predicted HicB family RNase H-like nuclease